MLMLDLSNRPYSKADHRRALLRILDGRTKSAVERKHQNISAVLLGMGETWIEGYKPNSNFQRPLVDAVARWLTKQPDWRERPPKTFQTEDFSETATLRIGPAPTLSNKPPPIQLERLLDVARRFDVAGKDERNRALGRAGEERIVLHERATLQAEGRGDLARKVRWVSEEDGDGAGYDIASFTPDGRSRLIEVKTTNGWERTPFFISRNELAVADAHRAEWCLVRLWDFSRAPKAFELRPPLDAHVSLTATTFMASFH